MTGDCFGHGLEFFDTGFDGQLAPFFECRPGGVDVRRQRIDISQGLFKHACITEIFIYVAKSVKLNGVIVIEISMFLSNSQRLFFQGCFLLFFELSHGAPPNRIKFVIHEFDQMEMVVDDHRIRQCFFNP